MNKYVLPSVVVAIIVGVGIGYYASQQCPMFGSKNGMINETKCALRRGMEHLWADHAVWDRQFTISTIAGLKDIDASKERLLKNQDDIGNAIIPYYGKETGAELTRLLKEHITIGGDIVKAAMAKNDTRVKDLDKQWRANAVQIAQLLSKANPHWTETELTTMFNKHLDLLTQDLHLRLSGNWQGEIAKADETVAQARMMGKDLADGIIQQFPEKF